MCIAISFNIAGTGFIFTLLNRTELSLVEGSTQTLCIQVIYPTNLQSLEQMRLIQVVSRSRESYSEIYESKYAIKYNFVC